MAAREHRPGEHVPSAGKYEELNVFGTPTGKVAAMRQDETLPGAPRGFTWRPLSELPAEALRMRAAEYRRMAETAVTAAVMTELRKIADRLDALADRRQREEQRRHDDGTHAG